MSSNPAPAKGATSHGDAGGKVPRHVAIIMDGNGRWAERRGLPRAAGHRAGAEAVRTTLKAAAKAGVESIARRVMKQALGSAPRFAVYMSCAGRGQGLYGAPDVESRILRQRFGDLPIAGMHSAFEIAPWGPGNAKVALYTGVLALFRSPS